MAGGIEAAEALITFVPVAAAAGIATRTTSRIGPKKKAKPKAVKKKPKKITKTKSKKKKSKSKSKKKK